MRFKRLFAFLLIAILACLFWSLHVLQPPAAWSKIDLGMSREQIHSILGVPTNEVFQNKGQDRWVVDMPLSTLTLNVFYFSESPFKVSKIWETSKSKITGRTSTLRGPRVGM